MAKKIGRPSIPKQERKAGFLSLRLSPAERKEIDKSAGKGGVPTTKWARAILLAGPTIVTLNEVERGILYRQSPADKKKGGWQRLIVTLQELTNEQTGEIVIPPILMERIPRYAFDYNQGGWEDRLKGIFSRTLGPNLDGNI